MDRYTSLHRSICVSPSQHSTSLLGHHRTHITLSCVALSDEAFPALLVTDSTDARYAQYFTYWVSHLLPQTCRFVGRAKPTWLYNVLSNLSSHSALLKDLLEKERGREAAYTLCSHLTEHLVYPGSANHSWPASCLIRMLHYSKRLLWTANLLYSSCALA
jgi:hypothetical protein